jgi:hypothetical protein
VVEILDHLQPERASMFFRNFGFVATAATFTLAASASQSLAADSCGLKQVASVPASLSSDGVLQIDVTINDIPVKLGVSSGSGVSTLAEKFARRAGLPFEDLHQTVYSSGQRRSSQKTHISSMLLGNAKTASDSFVLEPHDSDGTDGGIVGWMAEDFLSNYDIEVDLADGKLNLFEHDHCKGQVVYWSKEYFASPIYFSRSGTARRPEIDVVADGKTLKAMISTEWATTTLRQAVAEDRIGLTAGSAEMLNDGKWHDSDGKEFDRYSHVFKAFSFGDITLHNSETHISPINKGAHLETLGQRISSVSAEQPDIYIGMSLLKQLRFYISYDEDMIYYTIATPPKQAANQ